jgi:hypothetical protein
VLVTIRRLASTGTAQKMTRAPKQEGSISSIFTSPTGGPVAPLPARFQELKKEIWNDGMVESWSQVLRDLKTFRNEVTEKKERGVDVCIDLRAVLCVLAHRVLSYMFR